ncbi:MAG: hypothetical protein LKH27_11165 [Prevotella sp.]|jgi:hypothetical protein|nr:hypothetical protein [Prevotella sp.]MCI1474951.1 hypothetical protein [Prevotella sp.]MCI1548868.1 hypothetical protein [Prevotella sp.]MCI1596800.1 hypothetical protein [Prevotella sp.]
MNDFLNLPSEVLDNLSKEDMAMVVGGIEKKSNTINNGTGCGCVPAQRQQ